jgi:hypothetical protein
MLINFSCGSYPVRNYFNYVAIFAGHFADAGRILKGELFKNTFSVKPIFYST